MVHPPGTPLDAVPPGDGGGPPGMVMNPGTTPAATPVSDPVEGLAAAVAAATGHAFRERGLLLRACTHSSHPGRGPESNERFEFLGDALLGAALALLIHERFPAADEGQLSRLKSHLVSRSTLARAGEAAGVLAHCLVGAQMGGAWPDSVKANLVEALLAAIYFDGGWPALVEAVRRLLAGRIEDPDAGREDARMRLQVWSLEHHQRLPEYVSARAGGSDHQPEFAAVVSIAGLSAEGRGGSRRRAEAAAAGALLALVDAQRGAAPVAPMAPEASAG
jgi:ribonuclease-3